MVMVNVRIMLISFDLDVRLLIACEAEVFPARPEF